MVKYERMSLVDLNRLAFTVCKITQKLYVYKECHDHLLTKRRNEGFPKHIPV
jgi:hypothetical protein